MKLEEHQKEQLSLCFRKILELSEKQTKEILSQQQMKELEYFRQRKRELLAKIKQEQNIWEI